MSEIVCSRNEITGEEIMDLILNNLDNFAFSKFKALCDKNSLDHTCYAYNTIQKFSRDNLKQIAKCELYINVHENVSVTCKIEAVECPNHKRCIDDARFNTLEFRIIVDIPFFDAPYIGYHPFGFLAIKSPECSLKNSIMFSYLPDIPLVRLIIDELTHKANNLNMSSAIIDLDPIDEIANKYDDTTLDYNMHVSAYTVSGHNIICKITNTFGNDTPFCNLYIDFELESMNELESVMFVMHDNLISRQIIDMLIKDPIDMPVIGVARSCYNQMLIQCMAYISLCTDGIDIDGYQIRGNNRQNMHPTCCLLAGLGALNC